jgi:hypothetical protein
MRRLLGGSVERVRARVTCCAVSVEFGRIRVGVGGRSPQGQEERGRTWMLGGAITVTARVAGSESSSGSGTRANGG